jgi:hypothetical protein
LPHRALGFKQSTPLTLSIIVLAIQAGGRGERAAAAPANDEASK